MNMKTMMLGLMGLAASTMILRAEDDATLPVAQRLMRIDLDVAVRHYGKLQDTLRDSKLELLMNDGRLGANHPEQEKLQRKVEILMKLTDETRMEILELGQQLDKIAAESARAMAMNGGGAGMMPGFAVQRGIGGISVLDPTAGVLAPGGGGGIPGIPQPQPQPQFAPGSTVAPAGAVIPGGAPVPGMGFSPGGPGIPSATPMPRGRVAMPGAGPMAPPVPVPGSAVPGGPVVQPTPGLPPVAPPIEVRPQPTPPAIPAGPPGAGGPGAGMAPPVAEVDAGAPAATPAPAPELAPVEPEAVPEQ